MKSVQTKFLLLILSCVMFSVLAIGSTGYLTAGRVVEEDSAQIMKLQCTQKAQEIDERIRNIKQSVDTISHYVQSRINLDKVQSDKKYQEKFLGNMEDLLRIASENTEGAVSSYFRTSPEFSTSVSGVFLVRNDMTQQYEHHEITDLSKYPKDDREHVGWYYLPIQNGGPIWLEPYYNKNIGVRMISYVIPIFKGDMTVGVLGMDIDMDVLKGLVDSISLYENGYAFVISGEGDVIYHRDYPDGIAVKDFDEDLLDIKDILVKKKTDRIYDYTWRGQERKMTVKKLQNGMFLGVTVPSAEIEKPKNRLLLQVACSMVVILGISVILTIHVTGMVVKPLRHLTDAALKIADGDLGVSIQCKSKDEIGVLAKSFQKTAKHLNQYIRYINHLAYTDALTGVQNKTAYTDKTNQLELAIKSGSARFVVAVMDINNLKRMNDTYGHEYGDMLISDAAGLIQKSFGRENVYRIGGDEFSVILEEDCSKYRKMLHHFRESIIQFNDCNKRYQEKLQIACGIVEFEVGSDGCFSDAFKRADRRMYEDKAMLKRKAEEHVEEVNDRRGKDNFGQQKD